MRDLPSSLKVRRKNDWKYDSGRIFSSMCSEPLEKAWRAYEMFKDTNALDSDIFPSVDSLEREAVRKIGEFFSHPEAGGYISSGGTEGNIVALWLARKLNGGKRIVAPESVHYSVGKACDLQRLELVLTELDGEYRADVESIQENVDQETSAILVTAGTTALGAVDPIQKIAEIAEDNECFLHVDASFGGFVLPFLEHAPSWDFRVDQVSSITADPDKMGLVPIPAGAFLVRRRSWLDDIGVDAPYLPDTGPSLLGTRPGASVASVWTALNELGFDGYQKIVRRCLDLTSSLASGIREIGGLELMVEPELNIVGFKSEISSPRKIYRDLKERNWLVSLNARPESIRLVVMPHHRPRHINSFLGDLERYMEEES